MISIQIDPHHHNQTPMEQHLVDTCISEVELEETVAILTSFWDLIYSFSFSVNKDNHNLLVDITCKISTGIYYWIFTLAFSLGMERLNHIQDHLIWPVIQIHGEIISFLMGSNGSLEKITNCRWLYVKSHFNLVFCPQSLRLDF